MGAIPRQVGDFVSEFKKMVEDAELNSMTTVEEILCLILKASLRSGYRLTVVRDGLKMELAKATDDEIEISLDLNVLVVHLWRRNMPGMVKGLAHSKIVDIGELQGLASLRE